MADKKDVQDTEHVEDGLEKLFEDADRRYRVYRELRDVSKLFRPAPLPERKEPPSFDRPLFGTSIKQLFNYGKKRGACDVCNPGPSFDRPLFGTSIKQLYNYRKERKLCKECSSRPLPERKEPPSFERPLFGTSIKQLFNYGKKRVDAQP